MNDSEEDRKDQRRKKFLNKNNSKYDFSDDRRFISKSKKERKKKIEDMRGDELWEDWDHWDNK